MQLIFLSQTLLCSCVGVVTWGPRAAVLLYTSSSIMDTTPTSVTASRWTEPSLTSDQTGERVTAQRLILSLSLYLTLIHTTPPLHSVSLNHSDVMSFIWLINDALTHCASEQLKRSAQGNPVKWCVLSAGNKLMTIWVAGLLQLRFFSFLCFITNSVFLYVVVSAMSSKLNSFDILQHESRRTCQVWIIYSCYWIACFRMNNWIISHRFTGLRKTGRKKRKTLISRKEKYIKISHGHLSNFVLKRAKKARAIGVQQVWTYMKWFFFT